MKKTQNLNVLRLFYSVAFYGKFATLSDFWKLQDFFFWKTHLLFKKPQISNVLRNLTISVSFYGECATLWYKRMFQTREKMVLARLRELNWQKTGKRRNAPISEEDFVFHIFNMTQNNKGSLHKFNEEFLRKQLLRKDQSKGSLDLPLTEESLPEKIRRSLFLGEAISRFAHHWRPSDQKCAGKTLPTNYTIKHLFIFSESCLDILSWKLKSGTPSYLPEAPSCELLIQHCMDSIKTWVMKNNYNKQRNKGKHLRNFRHKLRFLATLENWKYRLLISIHRQWVVDLAP